MVEAKSESIRIKEKNDDNHGDKSENLLCKIITYLVVQERDRNQINFEFYEVLFLRKIVLSLAYSLWLLDNKSKFSLARISKDEKSCNKPL